MQKIIPFLWFDDNAEEAVDLYSSVFDDSKTNRKSHYSNEVAEMSGRAKGSVMTIDFELAGRHFVALNGGPMFKFSPAVSFFINCAEVQEINRFWEKLGAGGQVMMPLDTYPFAEKYGWIQDKFGVSWQLILRKSEQKITPCFLFVGERFGQAEQAIRLYTSLFDDAEIVNIERFGPDEGGAEGKIKYADFTLHGENFTAMESNAGHSFDFTQAISFMVLCPSQQEVDTYWSELTKNGEEQQCGWLKDRFGISWQIVPTVLNSLIGGPDKQKAKNAVQAMLQMKKLDIAELTRAYQNG